MKNYTYFFIMLGAIAISSAVLGETVRLSENRYPVSQKTQPLRYIERQPQDVYRENLPQQPEQQIDESLREDGWRPVIHRDEGYRGMRRGHWYYADEDYRPITDRDRDYYYTRRGHWHDTDREGLGGSRIWPWNW